MPLADLFLTASPEDQRFLAHARAAFQECQSTLLLGRNPLAQSAFILPALVYNLEAPTVDERGHALRHLLWWATESLAPSGHARGNKRQIADMESPDWLHYNLLRYLYLEPSAFSSHEDTLAAMGVDSPERFYEARSGALAGAGQWLLRQRDQGIGTDHIRALALESAHARLQSERAVLHMAGIASIFAYPVARSTMLKMAADESIVAPEQVLDRAISLRVLHAGEEGELLWMAEPLREFIAQRQPRTLMQSRHQAAARHALAAGEDVAAALHHYEGGARQQAASLLIELGQKAQFDGQAAMLAERIAQGEVTREQWRALQHLHVEAMQTQGRSDEALKILRDLLESAAQAGDVALEQASIYLDMGRIFSGSGGQRNDEQALALFKLGIEALAKRGGEMKAGKPAAEMMAEILKETAWIHVRQERGNEAEDALQRALRLLSANERQLRADIYDVFSTLRRAQGDFHAAIESAQAALLLREGLGDAQRLGRSYNALGILYRLVEEYDNALHAYQRALAIFQRLDNPVLVVTAMLNIGTAYHFTDRLGEAERWYRRCLMLAGESGLAATEVRAYANLCETLIGQGREEEARLHWRTAWARSHQMDFEAEIEYLKRVAERYPALAVELEEDVRLVARSEDASPVESANGATKGEVLQDNRSTELPKKVSARRGVSLETMLADASSEALVGAGATSSHKQDSATLTQEMNSEEPDPLERLRLAGSGLDEDEVRLLALLERVDSINVATAMEVTGASKATATRKLTRLTVRGLLVRHGMGRATYYTRAHNIPAKVLAADLEVLQNRLDLVTLHFARDYNLVRARVVGVRYGVRVDGDAELCYEVRASFTRNPMLDDFFELERALTKATGSRIQLTL